MTEEFLFVEKYRPQTIEETILPQQFKDQFKQFVDKGEIPNLLLSGLQVVVKLQLQEHCAMNLVQTIL